jgi:formate dehydrogenase subunit delta
MSPDKLVMMANQIGKFFASQGPKAAVPGIAEHIRKFWEPRMREAIFAHLDEGGTGLDPLVKQALQSLRQPASR